MCQLMVMLETLRRTEKLLADFEAQYNMGSQEFLVAFEDGTLPEKYDFYRWRATYVGVQKLKDRLYIPSRG